MVCVPVPSVFVLKLICQRAQQKSLASDLPAGTKCVPLSREPNLNIRRHGEATSEFSRRRFVRFEGK